MKNKSIAFDLDGTLIDISLRDYKIYYDIVKSLNGTPIEYDVYWPLRKKKTDIYYILAQSGIATDEDVTLFLDKRKLLMEDTEYLKLDSLLPRVLETLDELSLNYDIYIITIRSNIRNTMEQLHFLKIDKYEVLIADRCKIEYMRRVPNLFAVVGDTENDILPAKALGIQSVAVLSGIRNLEQLAVLSPDNIINDISELPEIMGYYHSGS